MNVGQEGVLDWKSWLAQHGQRDERIGLNDSLYSYGQPSSALLSH